MKKCLKTYFIVLLVAIAAIYSERIEPYTVENPGYKLVIRPPKGITLPSQSLRCLYHGNPLFIEKNHCLIPEDTFRNFFTLIITPSVLCQSTQNVPGALYRKKDIPYKWYTCILQPDQQISTHQKRMYKWDVKEFSGEAPLRIPEHSSIIVLLNPDLIEKVEATHINHTHLIHLPTIIMNGCATQQIVQESLDEAAISWIEIKQRHQSPAKKYKKHDEFTIIHK